MAIIRIEDAKLSFGDKTLFDGVSFTVNEGDRTGLVGNNGCGKSSLVKALMGEHELDKGSINKKRDARIGYVSQEIPESSEGTTCYDFLLKALPDQESDFWKVDVALSSLGLDSDLWHEEINALSGGWRRLLLIARATMDEPELLILDEPTNHLDLGKIYKLEDWLTREVKFPYLVISHDREFLDKCTNKTLFMRADGVHEFAAPFSVARENLFEADILASRQREKQEAEINRLEKAAKRMKEWGIRAPQSDIAKKGHAVQKRAELLKDRRVAVHQESSRDISLHYSEVTSNAIAIVSDTNVEAPGGKHLFSVDRFVVQQGDRVCVLGLNGTGKSVFIRKLIEELADFEMGPSDDMEYWFSPQVRLGYLDQHLEGIPEDKNPFDYVSGRFSLDRTNTTRELVSVGFPPGQQNMLIGDMSSGEKARLSLLVLKLSKPNFYVLDEPTNHLDIQGQEALEEELDHKGHTCIFVSHDRSLVRGASTRFVEVRNGQLIEVESPEPFFEKLQNPSYNADDEIDNIVAPPSRSAANKAKKDRHLKHG